MTIYIDIVMSILETISTMFKCGYTDRELLEYTDKHYDEIECELNGEEYKDPKKRDRYFCMDCKLRKIVDYGRSILVCTKCGVLSTIPFTCHHTIIRCNLREGNAYTKDPTILRLY